MEIFFTIIIAFFVLLGVIYYFTGEKPYSFSGFIKWLTTKGSNNKFPDQPDGP